jgi:hypothetical protein
MPQKKTAAVEAPEPEMDTPDLSTTERAEDYMRTLPNGIRVRVRYIPLDVSGFLVLDAKEGPWVVRAEGLHIFGLGINAVLERQPREAWIQASDTSLCANVTKEAAPVLLTLFEEVLCSPECTSWFKHDPTVERPVPYNESEFWPVRRDALPLEPE